MTHYSRTKLYGLLCTWLCFCLLPVRAQDIASNSNSLIVDARTEVICKSMTQSVERETRTVTILNKKGLDAAHFFCSCDMFRSLQKFSGELINASGESVRKIKKSELVKSEYSSSLTTDDYLYYYECNYPSFPFTVKYVWEVKCNNGLIGYSTFMPQMDFSQGVEKASYRIELPAGQQCRYRTLNTDGKNIQVKESTGPEGQQILEVSAAQLPPIVSEPFGPSFAELFPRVYFAPSAFSFDKKQGDMSTWQKYGEWQYSLLKDRDLLTEPFKSKLHELTANCTTDREKVKAVYDYLAKTTRYVSIQLGIGGLQPITATDVCRTGFGDCKGLSNYARAMLNELGIPSTLYGNQHHQRTAAARLLQCQPDEPRHSASASPARYTLAGMHESAASFRLCPSGHCRTRRPAHPAHRGQHIPLARLSRLAEYATDHRTDFTLAHRRSEDRSSRSIPAIPIRKRSGDSLPGTQQAERPYPLGHQPFAGRYPAPAHQRMQRGKSVYHIRLYGKQQPVRKQDGKPPVYPRQCISQRVQRTAYHKAHPPHPRQFRLLGCRQHPHSASRRIYH